MRDNEFIFSPTFPVFPLEPRYFLFDSFLPDVGVKYDWAVLKIEALYMWPIAEFVDFWILFVNFYEILQPSC